MILSAPNERQNEPAEHAGSRVADHELLRCIGRGSYGEVWLARTVLGELRAAKLVFRRNFEDARPFEREFEGIQKFEPISRKHPSQVAILQVGRNDEAGYFYYVMELADNGFAGEGVRRVTCDSDDSGWKADRSLLTSSPTKEYTSRTLKLELSRRGRLPLEACVQIGLALTTALEHLHSHGLVHRDVKPSNIVFINGTPKLADIGLIASADATMSFVGTAGYLAPEGPGNPQADIYSLGKVLYEMSVGRDRGDFPALPENWREFADAKGFSDFNAVILKACAWNCRERYGSASEMREDLELLARGEPVKTARNGSRSIITKMAFTALLIVFLSATGLFVQRKIQEGSMDGTRNREAYNTYVQGRAAMRQRNREGLTRGLQFMQKAIELDPTFVRAWGELFINYLHGRWPEQVAGSQKTLITKKLQDLNANSPEAHYTKAALFQNQRRFTEAEKEYKLAIRAGPKTLYAHSLYSTLLFQLGRIDEVHAELNKCFDIDATFWFVPDIRGDCYAAEGRFQEALAEYGKAAEIAQQNFGAYYRMAQLYEATEEIAKAIEAREKGDLYSGHPPAEVAAVSGQLREALAKEGEQGYWKKQFELSTPSAASKTSTYFRFSSYDPWRLSVLYAHVGDHSEAIAMLKEAEQRNRGLTKLLLQDKVWASFRDNEEFRSIAQRAGIKL